MKNRVIRFAVSFSLLWASLFLHGLVHASETPFRQPTGENPLVVDREGKRVLIYTEVNEKSLHETTAHWGVVARSGALAEKAILQAYCTPLDFYDALVEIGAKPGDNLTANTLGIPVRGSSLAVTATWPELGKELSLPDIFFDQAGKGFDIRFGGNRKASAAYGTGCITCLESCWVAVTSNAAYPNISQTKRFLSPNSRFKGKEKVLPGGGKPVILIYRLLPETEAP